MRLMMWNWHIAFITRKYFRHLLTIIAAKLMASSMELDVKAQRDANGRDGEKYD